MELVRGGVAVRTNTPSLRRGDAAEASDGFRSVRGDVAANVEPPGDCVEDCTAGSAPAIGEPGKRLRRTGGEAVPATWTR